MITFASPVIIFACQNSRLYICRYVWNTIIVNMNYIVLIQTHEVKVLTLNGFIYIYMCKLAQLARLKVTWLWQPFFLYFKFGLYMMLTLLWPIKASFKTIPPIKVLIIVYHLQQHKWSTTPKPEKHCKNNYGF